MTEQYKVQLKLTVVPDPDTPNHSYIEQVNNMSNMIHRTGPVPDVLVNEVVYEMQQTFQATIKTMTEGFENELRG